MTQRGQAKLIFDLVDGEGSAITVHGVGRNANRWIVKAQMEVVIFHGSVRAGIGSSEGAIWIFKDAMIVPIGMKHQPVTIVRRINI